MTPIFGKIVVEVRHRPVFALLDRKGEIVDNLAQILGPAFRPNLRPDGVDLADGAGMVVNIGAANFSVSHELPRTIALAERVAAQSWRTITSKGGAPRRATRLGTRFWLWWPVADAETGRRVLRNGGLGASVPPAWVNVFGEPSETILSVRSQLAPDKKARIQLDVVRNAVHVAMRDPWLDHERMRADVPEWALQLDIDVSHETAGKPFELSVPELDSMVREHWERVSPWLEKLGRFEEEHDAE